MGNKIQFWTLSIALLLYCSLSEELRFQTKIHEQQYFELIKEGYKVDFQNRLQITLIKENHMVIFPLYHTSWKERNVTEKSTGISKIERDGYFEFFPLYLSTLYNNETSQWTAPCFPKYFGTISVGFNTTRVQIEAVTNFSSNCFDLLLLGTPTSLTVVRITAPVAYGVDIQNNPVELNYISTYGYQVFLIQGGYLGLIEDVFDTLLMFLPGPVGLQNELKFLNDYMGRTFESRNNTNFTIPHNLVKSGDPLLLFKLGGPHGAENDMEGYGTGGYADHVAMCLWIDGVLYVVESMGGSKNGPSGIMKTPFDDWVNNQRSLGNMVNWLRLNSTYLAQFNETAAVEFFQQNEGLPYGTHNYIFGWIDTINDNYPPPLSMQVMPVVFQLWESFDYASANNVFLQALNFRLNTTNLNMTEIILECGKQNTTIYELVTVVEEDTWVYDTGPSMVCSAFVMAEYKHANVFGSIQFQATEFTPKDVYILSIFDDSWQQPQECQEAGLPWCQISGIYYLDLPDFNTWPPHNNMAETCGGVPPDYIRSPSC